MEKTMKNYDVILFDLDGTITDPGIGITNSVAHALKKYGITVEDRAELYKFIGPPLHESFEKFYGLDGLQAVEDYREYYRDRGIYENVVYGGVEEMLKKLKAVQDEMKSILGKDYHKYDLVMATDYGLPIGEAAIRKRFKKLIKEHNLPEVVFHSLRHTSVTYKLKLNGGDIKAVQGDSGHSQVNMVTDVYSHILDEDRKRNAELFEEAFYGKKNLNPQMVDAGSEKMITVPDGVEAETLMKVLVNPEMVALLTSLAKTMRSAMSISLGLRAFSTPMAPWVSTLTLMPCFLQAFLMASAAM
jgi:hypothetical protein